MKNYQAIFFLALIVFTSNKIVAQCDTVKHKETFKNGSIAKMRRSLIQNGSSLICGGKE